MRIIDLAVALIFFTTSAGVTAFVMAVFIHNGLGVPPAALRHDALISAGFLSLVLLVAMTTIRKKED
ncbi:hypothetical protein IVB22_23495 [Bradyrhizobium sp. 190]|uniref:hypothetical protein n=1 Tax=Bradyrhizobium sp. 190 TaxID=2782658 RepID=UPI001FF9D352|nr:hypothetical protein [Bradyrhizobium sp. 190]MCK1515463.1 hypothetical protein [Bradyrhizobium sp. 190]